MGASKTENAITRVGKCIGPLAAILDQFNEVNQISEPSGRHVKPSSEKDRDKIMEELTKRVQVFSIVPGRTHAHL